MQLEWLTVQEAANRLGVARATLYKWAKEGRLPIYKLGERVARIRVQDLDRLLSEARPLYVTGSLGELRLTNTEKRAVSEAKDEIARRFPLEELILFGSAARNKHGKESDIDLLAITGKKLTHRDRNVIYDIIFEINYKYGTNLSVVVVDAFSWNQGVLSLTSLHAEIRQGGIPV